jgi:hypothetical protein
MYIYVCTYVFIFRALVAIFSATTSSLQRGAWRKEKREKEKRIKTNKTKLGNKEKKERMHYTMLVR